MQAWAGRSARRKPDFVGKRSLERPAMRAAGRKQLVGLLTVDPAIVLEEGAQVAAEAGQKPPMRLIGHVTSSYASAVVGRSIALAMVVDGRARIGQTTARADAARRHRRRSHRAGVLRPRREHACMSDAAVRRPIAIATRRLGARAATPQRGLFSAATGRRRPRQAQRLGRVCSRGVPRREPTARALRCGSDRTNTSADRRTRRPAADWPRN